MSEIESIGERLGLRLQASHFMQSIEVALQAKSLVLTLLPKEGLVLSERIMRFCLNFLGEQPPTGKSEIFAWATSFVTFDDGICRIWVDCSRLCGYMGIDLIAELILLGCTLSQSLSRPSLCYNIGDLLRVYRTREEVLAFYAGFASRVIGNDDDLHTKECDPALRDLWLCCPKHRLLFVQRLLLNGWLHHIFWNFEVEEEYAALADIEYLDDAPSAEAMARQITELFEQALTPQMWLEARCAHAALVEWWERPTPQCQRKHHVSWACCAFHVALKAMGYLFTSWLVHFDSLYHMSSMVNERGRTAGLASINGIALLIHLAQLDSQAISFTGWFEDVPSVDITTFHRREEGQG